MLGFPKGPMQIEEDLAQIRHDIDVIRNDISWMKEYGFLITQVMLELKNIRRLMEINLGETTREEVLKHVEEDNKQVRQFEEENEKRMRVKKERWMT